MSKILLPILLITNIYSFNLPQPVCNGVGEIKYTNATYIGECQDNKKEGHGKVVFTNGVKYEGDFKNDKKNGHGTQHYANGMIYKGEWKNDNYDGDGVLKYNSTEKYDGNWKKGKRDGRGIYTYPNGAVYDGEWKNDAKHGYGVFKYSNGIVYKGTFVNNMKDGKGIMTYSSGDTYDGDFKKAKQNGYGVFTYKKGGSYTGDWVMGKREGKGKYIYASGAIYDGSWLNNKKDGVGKYTDTIGNIYLGSWKENKQNGHGVLTYSTGEIYDGEWKNDKKNGKAKDISQYGTCEGTYKDGELVSIVNEYTQGEAYKFFNEMRLNAGMFELRYNSILQDSAQSHSDYIGLHIKTLEGLDYHHEKENLKGFRGVDADDRAVKAGYFSRGIGEGISNYCNAKASINSLMTAIYHRFGILTFDKDEVGIGFTKDPKNLERNLVHNTGNSNLNILCQRDNHWIGNYFEKVCADEKLKIKKTPYNKAKAKVKEKNPKYVIWPVDASVDNLYYFEDEVPDPMPNYKRTGNPISIQFNPYYFPDNIVVYSFRIYKGKEEIKETRLLTKQTDPNKKFTKNQYALFPIKPLERDTEYKVVIKYKYGGNSKRISTSFRTMK